VCTEARVKDKRRCCNRKQLAHDLKAARGLLRRCYGDGDASGLAVVVTSADSLGLADGLTLSLFCWQAASSRAAIRMNIYLVMS